MAAYTAWITTRPSKEQNIKTTRGAQNARGHGVVELQRTRHPLRRQLLFLGRDRVVVGEGEVCDGEVVLPRADAQGVHLDEADTLPESVRLLFRAGAHVAAATLLDEH